MQFIICFCVSRIDYEKSNRVIYSNTIYGYSLERWEENDGHLLILIILITMWILIILKVGKKTLVHIKQLHIYKIASFY